MRECFDAWNLHFLLYTARTHADIAMISPEALHTELTRVEVALKKILGIKPKFFRPPYGSYNAAALQVLEERGYHSKLKLHCHLSIFQNSSNDV